METEEAKDQLADGHQTPGLQVMWLLPSLLYCRKRGQWLISIYQSLPEILAEKQMYQEYLSLTNENKISFCSVALFM